MTKMLLREKAVRLRNEGYSYSYISDRIKVSKGTLSEWLSHLSYTPNEAMKIKIGKARIASNIAKHKLKAESIQRATIEAKASMGQVSNRDLFLFGLGLYLGEGTKHRNVRVINANPAVIRFIIRWFEKFCGLTKSNFKIRLHLYPDNDIKESVRFWSRETSIPETQFHKTQIDFRKDKKFF